MQIVYQALFATHECNNTFFDSQYTVYKLNTHIFELQKHSAAIFHKSANLYHSVRQIWGRSACFQSVISDQPYSCFLLQHADVNLKFKNYLQCHLVLLLKYTYSHHILTLHKCCQVSSQDTSAIFHSGFSQWVKAIGIQPIVFLFPYIFNLLIILVAPFFVL